MSESLDYSRRVFLRALGLSAAGLAVGAGAAWAYGQAAEQEALQTVLRDAQAQLAEAQASRATLDGAVATLQGQVTTLDAQLGASVSQNAQLAGALTDSQNEAQVLRAQLSDAQSRIAAAEARMSRYQELIALFDQLEGVGLDALAQDGLKAAAAGIAGALGLAPLLRGGLETARGLLDDFERVLPDFHAGLTWLGDQVIKLKLDLYALEKAAQTTLSAASAGVTALFGGFIKFVLDHLPFDVGEKTRATLHAAQTLIAETADTTGQTDERVFGKMSRYVSGGPNSWQTKLLAPVREQTLAPADGLLKALDDAQTTFDQALNVPAQAALAQRAALREKITAHRSMHQL